MFMMFDYYSDFKSVNACWKRNSDSCEQTVKRVFEGVQEAFHYICGDGFDSKIYLEII